MARGNSIVPPRSDSHRSPNAQTNRSGLLVSDGNQVNDLSRTFDNLAIDGHRTVSITDHRSRGLQQPRSIRSTGRLRAASVSSTLSGSTLIGSRNGARRTSLASVLSGETLIGSRLVSSQVSIPHLRPANPQSELFFDSLSGRIYAFNYRPGHRRPEITPLGYVMGRDARRAVRRRIDQDRRIARGSPPSFNERMRRFFSRYW